MKKSTILFVFAFLFLVSALSVSAVDIILVSPVNGTVQRSSTVTYTFNLTNANTTDYNCDLHTTENESSGPGGWVAHETITGVGNASQRSFTSNINVKDAAGGTAYVWSVFCNATLDPTGSFQNNITNPGGVNPGTVNASFGVDIVDPSVSIADETPTDGEWLTSGAINISLTVTDNNADACVLTTTLNGTGNSTQSFMSESTISYTNATVFNFSRFDGIDNSFADNNTGAYVFSYTCNDTAGNSVTSDNVTFFVDTVAPTTFVFNTGWFQTSPGAIALPNGSVATDYTPELAWNVTVEANFSRYEVNFYNVAEDTILVQKNITTRTENITNMSALSGDTNYHIMITAYDLAGHAVNMSNGPIKYTTSSICQALNDGWNICANLWNAKSLSQLLNETNATSVAYLNYSNQFDTHVSGGSGGTISVPYGEAFLAFMNGTGNWSDSVQNTSVGTITRLVRNESNTDWNLVVMTNHTANTTFQELDYNVNGNLTDVVELNLTFFSLHNNSASSGSRRITFVNNLTINNGTILQYGDPIWVFVSIGQNQTIDWTR